MSGDELLLTAAVMLVALLYASVGHAGASGYIAVMSLAGIGATTIKPAALVLNLVVASLATWQFRRAGHFRAALLWPFAVGAVPAALLGGWLQLPLPGLRLLLGLTLLLSAMNFLLRAPADGPTRPPSRPVALVTGVVLGLLAGLTGTGGGIYLTPLMLLCRWAPTRQVAAVSAPFILLNSLAGLGGHLLAGHSVPGFVVPLLAAVALGGALGAWLGARWLLVPTIKRVLAVVLAIAGFKLVGLA